MSKKILFAFLVGYCFHSFRKSPLWIGAKHGLKLSILKIVKEDFPKLYEEATANFSPAERERIETKLRSV